MEQKNVCVKVSSYTAKVLGVVKEKFGLKDKGEAMDMLADLYGESFVEKSVNEEVIAEALDISQRHLKKHGMHKMSVKELDTLFER